MSSQTDTRTQVERLRRGYDNFGKGDLEAIRADFAPDIVWHVGGNNPLTGDYKGLDDVFALFGRFFQETGGTLKNEVHDVLANVRVARTADAIIRGTWRPIAQAEGGLT